MAHFAQLDSDNTVLRVIVVNNDVLDSNGIESEQKGINFCNQLLGGTWIQTSYNGSFRANFAGPHFTYDPDQDVFIPPRPSESHQFDSAEFRWILPVDSA